MGANETYNEIKDLRKKESELWSKLEAAWETEEMYVEDLNKEIMDIKSQIKELGERWYKEQFGENGENDPWKL